MTKRIYPSKRKIILLFAALGVLIFIILQKPLGSLESPSLMVADHSVDDATSVWVVVNKGRKLPDDYIPANLVTPDVALRLENGMSEMKLRKDAATALEHLFKDAKAAGLDLLLASAYRSYEQQSGLYNFYVEKSGQKSADEYSARPGYSEHQTGLGVDVEPSSRECELQECFASTAEGIWVAANAHRQGFIIRYEKGEQNLTGYEFEPWHLRYIGIELATELKKSGKTMEQHFNLPAYPDYPLSPIQLKY
jgi:zinc D-Ala-D-Ala carboxypeptidase